jgi:hypothetical protein
MHFRKAFSWGFGFFFLAAFSVFAQQGQFISYSVNGNKFQLTDVKLQSSAEGDFIHVEGVRKDRVDLGKDAIPRYREAEAGITFELSLSASPVGTHVAHSSDTMPVYVNWYELKKDNSGKSLKEILASMDSGDETQLEFSVTFENFGPTGTLVKGTFFGRLLDEDGNSYKIEEGKFAIQRTDME